MVSVQNFRQHNQSQTRRGFGFDEMLKLEALPNGAKWSHTYKCWYIEYNTESYQKITTTFPDIEILHDTSKKPETPAPGLKRGHDIAPIVAHKQSNALQPLMMVEHKAKSNGKDEKEAEYISIAGKYWFVKIPYSQRTTKALFSVAQRPLREQSKMIKTSKSDNFMVIFTSYSQL
jgi:hypothetical protein